MKKLSLVLAGVLFVAGVSFAQTAPAAKSTKAPAKTEKKSDKKMTKKSDKKMDKKLATPAK